MGHSVNKNKVRRKKRNSFSNNSSNSGCKRNNRKSKKRRKIRIDRLICVFLVVVVVISIATFSFMKIYFYFNNLGEAEDLRKEIYCKEVKEKNIEYNNGIPYANNQISLISREGSKKEDIKKLAKQYNAKIVGYIEFTGDYQLEFSRKKSYEELNSIVSQLETDHNVESASLYIFAQGILNDIEGKTNSDFDIISFYPNDPWSTWGKSDWDKINPEGKNWGAEAIHATEAWALKDEMDYVKIGILEFNNFDTNHEDLIFTKVWNFKSNKNKDHGTHIAGTIGAISGNGIGVSGICPKATLYGSSIRNSEEYTGIMEIKCALARLILNDVKVINCSFHIYLDLIIAAGLKDQNIIVNETAKENIQYDLNVYKDSLTRFLSKFINKGYDFLIIEAAGNENSYYYEITDDIEKYPYGVEVSKEFKLNQCKNIDSKYNSFGIITDENIKNKIIDVGSCRLDNFKLEGYSLSEFSNIGERVDVIAPGEEIYSTLPKNSYGKKDGTSMAAPHVTGLAGMIWGINKDLSAEQVKNIILKTANIDVANTNKKIINARMAVNLANTTKGEDFLSGKGAFLCSVADESKYVENNTSVEIKEYESINKAVIKDVRVTLKDRFGNEVATFNSDSSGEVINLVNPGTYDIVFEKEGYESSILRDVEIISNDITYKKVLLKKI